MRDDGPHRSGPVLDSRVSPDRGGAIDTTSDFRGVTDQAGPRHPDPTLGVAVLEAGAGTAAHPLVTVGDSLTHGMSSGAVSRPDTGWPAMVAACLGADLHPPAGST